MRSTGHTQTNVGAAIRAALGLGVAALLFLTFVSPAHASGEHVERVYSPALSLTGGCNTSEEDPIADPGLCPMPPGVPGVDHPFKRFRNPCGLATDSYGDIYVASVATGTTEGRIDVFDSAGEYLTEIKDEYQPCSLAVDSEGNLYVVNFRGIPYEDEFGGQEEFQLQLYAPESYPPQPGDEYAAPVVVERNEKSQGVANALAVDPSNDHLYAKLSFRGIVEFGSAAENLPGEDWVPLREEIGEGIEGANLAPGGVDVYGKNGYIYSSGEVAGGENRFEDQRVYIVNPATNEPVCESDGSDTPAGHFSFIWGGAAVAVDQSNGDFYVADTAADGVVDRLDSECHYVDQLPMSPPKFRTTERFGSGLAVDDPCLGTLGESCDLGGYHSSDEGNVYVGSGEKESNSHMFAFEPVAPHAPEVEAQTAIEITDTGARLRALVNPHGHETTFSFEYISQADYEADGETYGTGASTAPITPAAAGAGASFTPVSVSVFGLTQHTSYRFRLVAESTAGVTVGEGNLGGEGEDATFSTYRSETPGLPDHRGYELVTPPDTGGYVPTTSELGFWNDPHVAFPTDFASGGNSLLFGVEGGSLPSLPGGGYHDIYEAHREADGAFGHWRTEFNGIDGTEALRPNPGGFDSAHAASFWAVEKGGGATEANAGYVLRMGGVLDPRCSIEPSSRLESIGCGSLGIDPYANGKWISPGAGHVVFATASGPHLNGFSKAVQLEPTAAPTGTDAVYDRTSDGVTHVVSLKPDGSAFGSGENASYQGASHDGSAVVFAVGETLYVHLDDERTLEVTGGSVDFAGISPDGGRILYLRPNVGEPLREIEGEKFPQGDIFACDVRSGPCAGPEKSHDPIQIGSGEESILVNVSADGSHVYFVSPKVLDEAEEGTDGAYNLYLWDGSAAPRFVADLTARDVAGREILSSQRAGGLGLWVTSAMAPHPDARTGPANDPSRTTPDGSVLLFESRADLTGYDNAGHSEIYRYDSGAPVGKQLACLSCNPTDTAAASDAQLESDPPAEFVSLPPLNAIAQIANVTDNGNRAFFQSVEPLVVGDIDGKTDVYEWEAAGEGTCTEAASAFDPSAAGCIFLVSSGRSSSDDYLYAMSDDGHDVFFESGDLLVPRDHEAAPSIYDARVDGGEVPESPVAGECLGEACQPNAVAPDDPSPASLSFEGSGNVREEGATKTRCPKGKRKVKTKGKTRCVKRHAHKRKHHKRHRRANHNRTAPR